MRNLGNIQEVQNELQNNPSNFSLRGNNLQISNLPYKKL